MRSASTRKDWMISVRLRIQPSQSASESWLKWEALILAGDGEWQSLIFIGWFEFRAEWKSISRLDYYLSCHPIYTYDEFNQTFIEYSSIMIFKAKHTWFCLPLNIFNYYHTCSTFTYMNLISTWNCCSFKSIFQINFLTIINFLEWARTTRDASLPLKSKSRACENATRKKSRNFNDPNPPRLSRLVYYKSV